MYIKEVYLENFKSFHDQKFVFNKGMTVVTGSNGSGKSNIFDAVIFCLGNASPKTLRYKNLNELIHKSLDADYGKVTLVFDDGTKLERSIADGTTLFRVNGARTTLEATTGFLKEKGITCQGHNIVMQDDVKRIVELTDVERRKLIDEIAHVARFDEQKQKALKNLESVNEKIKQTRLVLDERKEWLTKLESEKALAEKFFALDRNKIIIEATILKKEKKQLQKDLATYSTRVKNIDDEIKSSSEKISDAIKLIGEKERQLVDKKNCFESKNKDYTNVTSTFNIEKYKFEELEKQKKTLEEEKHTLQSRLKEIETKIKEFNCAKETSVRELRRIESDLKQDGKEMQKVNVSELKNQIDIELKNKESAKAKIKGIENEIDSVKAKIKEIDINEALALHNKERIKQIDDDVKLLKQEKFDDYTNKLKSTDSEINAKESAISKQTLQFSGSNDKLKHIEMSKVKYEQEIETLSTVKLKTTEPIQIETTKDIEKYIDDKESKNEFGTFVFILKKDKDKIKDSVIIKNILPSNKIKRLETEVKELIGKITEETKNKIKLEKELDIAKKELRSLVAVRDEFLQRAYENDYRKEQVTKRLSQLEQEKSNMIIESVKSDKKELEKELLSLEKEKESYLADKYDSKIKHITSYLTFVDDYNKKTGRMNEFAIEIARIEERVNQMDSEALRVEHILKEKRFQEASLTKNYNSLKSSLETAKQNFDKFEQTILKEKEDMERTEQEIADARNEKNRLNDIIVKGEAEKHHMLESTQVKQAQLEESSKEIDSFIELNKHRDIDFSNLDTFEQRAISELRETIIEIKIDLDQLGAVNLKSITDYSEFKQKYDEIVMKIGILEEERDEVQKDIDQISQQKEHIFMGYYTKIKANFRRITKEFGLGDVDLILTQVNLDDAGVQIVVKKSGHEKTLSSLSGGEKSLTTIAFVLSIVEFEPAPFYLFDEIDAALDFKNTEKVLAYLDNLAERNQIIMISHNPESVEKADFLIGLSKNKLGITTVGVKQKREFQEMPAQKVVNE